MELRIYEVQTAVKSSSGAQALCYALKNKPVIATLVHEADLQKIIRTSSNIVFILKTDIFSIEQMVQDIQGSGKLAFVHIDLLDGIGKDRAGVLYLADKVGIDGIVTTKAPIIAEAKKSGLTAIHRLFVFDSVSLDNGLKLTKSSQPDAIEVLPGIVTPRIMKRVREETDVPVIAGGLMTDIQDVDHALKSGVIGISTSTKELWDWQDNLT